MNRHGEKIVYATPRDPGFDPAFGGVVAELYRCPRCGAGASSQPAAKPLATGR